MTEDPKGSPAPVEVTNPEPIDVKVSNPNRIPVDTGAETVAKTVASKADVSERALTAAGQRSTSLIWERTQQIIAISVVEMTLVVVSIVVATPGVATIFGYAVPEAATAAASTGIVFLASVANLVIGFYFGRTNHTRVGGPGGDETGRSR